MKKIFTTLCLASLVGLGANAELLTVTVDGNPVKNGDVVTSSNVESFEAGGVVVMWELKPHTIIKASEGVDLVVTVNNPEGKGTVTYKDGTPQSTPISFCGVNAVGGMPGTCFTVNPGESKDVPQTLDNGVEGELQCYFMSSDYINPVPENLEAYAEVEIAAEGESGADETFKFTLKMVYPATGVKGVSASDANFSVANGSVVADGVVEVYDLSGRRVANENLSGMYIVRSEGKVAKVVVK